MKGFYHGKTKKLPSGNYRVQLFIGKENGKRLYKSFTADTAKEAKYMALEYELSSKDKSKPLNLTIGEAMDKYINAKSNVLSPSTVGEYKRSRNRDYTNITNTKLCDLKQEYIQIEMNEIAADHSPKTVRNIHGFLSTVLKLYHPHFILNTTLPQKNNTEILIPSEEEVCRILEDVKGTIMEAPMYLAACCGLRRSEICGLKWDCINLNKRTIKIKYGY